MTEQDNAQSVMRDARKLKEERFPKRNAMLKARSEERYNQTVVEVPPAYKKTTQQHSSNIIADEGRQIGTLVYAMPVPHIAPPSPEDQPLTSKVEQFLIAMHQELEEHYGPAWWQCTAAQVHDNLGWIFFAPKRKPYKGQPKPPKGEDYGELADYGLKNDRFKKDAGISAVFDYEYAVTSTVLYDGPVYNPKCVYVWKHVPASTFKKTYGEMENVTGRPEQSGSESMINVVEYWDKERCLIVCETTETTYSMGKQEKGVRILDEWTHNWGRVPYFARPCFVTDQLDEEKKYEGPLDGIYNEMPNHKRLRTMCDSVAYQTAFAPLKITSDKDTDVIVDDDNKPLAFLELEPGKARQLAPGQDVSPVGQSPEVQNLFMEMAASHQRLEKFMLSPVSKGVSPGADTANSALSNLHRFQLHSMDPMAQQISRQGQAMYRFALERIREMGETVFAFNAKTDQYLSLNGTEIISVNVQAKATPDQGQFRLLVEKHATELWMSRAISKIDMYEMMGYENPEEKARAVEIEDYAMSLKPIVQQQVTSMIGMLDALNAMIQSQAETGSARNAVPGLMQQASAMQQGQTGMGSGSPGQPRGAGVRSPVQDVNTQEAQVGY